MGFIGFLGKIVISLVLQEVWAFFITTNKVSLSLQNGSFIIKSIWKAWEQIKPYLQWKGLDSGKRFSAKNLNVWWYSIFTLQGLLLATFLWIHAKRFYKKGIATLLDFFSMHDRGYLYWPLFESKYELHLDYKSTYEAVLDTIHVSVLFKLHTQDQRSWWS